MNTMEQWKDIQGHEGFYQVSSEGRVRSLDREVEAWNGKSRKNTIYHFKGKVLAQTKDVDGYMLVALGKYCPNQRVHRLVAMTFIPNPNNYEEVGHWDCDVSNNKVENLYWCSRTQNMNHPITKERIKNSKELKPILQIDKETGEILKEYESLHEMNRQTNYSRWAVSECCRGNALTYKGFKWMYK